jgi:hypothetical protein
MSEEETEVDPSASHAYGVLPRHGRVSVGMTKGTELNPYKSGPRIKSGVTITGERMSYIFGSFVWKV